MSTIDYNYEYINRSHWGHNSPDYGHIYIIYIFFSVELIYSAKTMNYEGLHNVVQSSLGRHNNTMLHCNWNDYDYATSLSTPSKKIKGNTFALCVK